LLYLNNPHILKNKITGIFIQYQVFLLQYTIKLKENQFYPAMGDEGCTSFLANFTKQKKPGLHYTDRGICFIINSFTPSF